MRATRHKPRLPARSLARRALFPAIEATWTWLFWLFGFILRPSPVELTFSGVDRVLVIAPHPDDETLGCGGTIVRHAEAGDSVRVLVVTDGGGSRARGLTRQEMVKLRAAEAHRAAKRLHPDMNCTLGGFPEGKWHADHLLSLLTQQLAELRPTIIYTPSCVDFHPEHVKVARRLADTLAATPTATDTRIRVYELQVPLALPLVNRWANIRNGCYKKRAALGEYWTQRQSFGWRGRQERYLRALFGLPVPIEVFREMSASAFIRVMLDISSGTVRYRGLRQRPFSDGVAWIVGTRGRRRVREASSITGALTF